MSFFDCLLYVAKHFIENVQCFQHFHYQNTVDSKLVSVKMLVFIKLSYCEISDVILAHGIRT